MSIDHAAYLDHLRDEAELLASTLEHGPLQRPVPSCPGWDLRRLAAHVGVVHRWATQAVLTGEAPSARPLDPDEDTDLVTWFREGAAGLLQALGATPPDRPTWHPFPAPKVVATWARRQAHETTIHRWDAQLASGRTDPLDPTFASDGIDEYLDVMLPRKLQRDGLAAPGSTLHVHCTDVPGEWLVAPRGASIALERVHTKGDAALRGPAEALLLALWGRGSADGLEVIGSQAAAEEWLTVGGV